MIWQLAQPGILAPTPCCGRSLVFRQLPDSNSRAALSRLRDAFNPDDGVIGLGESLVRRLGGAIPGLRDFPELLGPAGTIPSTQQALWALLRGRDPGAIFELTEGLKDLLAESLAIDDSADTFTYADGRDLTGYLDGTANPSFEDSPEFALVATGAGLAGSSFVAVQRWVHDLLRFRDHSQPERDAIIGRSIETNEELADAPESAHVKRTAQEDYEPPAFMVRRSMPWSTGKQQGLEFIAYGKTLGAFEQVMKRMVGLDDGLADALFSFSKPVTGGYYWCPPVQTHRLDLSAIGL